MDNNQKLDLIVKLERRAKRRKIIAGIVIALLAGSIMIYSQYKNLESVEISSK